jgi:hypothetical protein
MWTMTKRALLGLLGVTMMGVACGTSPTAVELPSLEGLSAEGMASASGARRAEVAPACVAKVELKVVATGSGKVKWARVRASFYASSGKPAGAECGVPTWNSTKGSSLVPARFDAFEATISGAAGKYLVTATAEGGRYAQLVVGLE